MTNKPYYNLCRNRHIIEQMTGSSANNSPAQEKKMGELLNTHSGNAYNDGIDEHGHWDLTTSDSNKIIKPHFDQYFYGVRSIDPNADENEHRKLFDDNMNTGLLICTHRDL